MSGKIFSDDRENFTPTSEQKTPWGLLLWLAIPSISLCIITIGIMQSKSWIAITGLTLFILVIIIDVGHILYYKASLWWDKLGQSDGDEGGYP